MPERRASRTRTRAVQIASTIAAVATALFLHAAATTGPEAEHISTVRRVFDEALNRGDFRVFDDAYHPDFVKHVGSARYSLAEERRQAEGTRRLASGLHMEVDRIVADGDLVAVFYTGRGVNDGPFGSAPATGRRFEIRGATLYRFSGLRIVEEWTVYDQLDLLQQLGLAPTG